MESTPDDVTPHAIVCALAEIVQQVGAATTVIGGKICFHVRGKSIQCWTLDLDVPGGDWIAEATAAKECTTVYATQEAFCDLLLQPQNVPEHVRTGRFDIGGDADRLLKLGEWVGACDSPLGVLSRHRSQAQ